MSEAIVKRNTLSGYDVVTATVQDFKDSVRAFRRSPKSECRFRNMWNLMRFMQTDDTFEMLRQGADALIEDTLEKAGFSLKEILQMAMDETNLE